MAKKPTKPFGKKGAPAKKSEAKKPKPVTKKPEERTRGLGRGLSALMADVAPVPVAAIPDDLETKSDPQREADAEKLQAQLQRKWDDQDVEDGPAYRHRPKNEQPAPPPTPKSTNVTYIAIDRIDRNRDQPRQHFNADAMMELTESIRDKGVLQPILVRPMPEGYIPPLGLDGDERKMADYQIIAGERRWLASIKAGLDAMPVFIRDFTDVEILEIGVIENIHREGLNPIDEARAYRKLQSEFGRTQKEISEAVGKSRSYITNMLRLLNLPDLAQRMLATEDITLGHARAIIAAPDPSHLAEVIADQGLSVREAEDWVRRLKEADSYVRPVPVQKDADIRALEKELTTQLGLAVDIKHRSPGGEIRVKYKTGEQLEDVLRRLRG